VKGRRWSEGKSVCVGEPEQGATRGKEKGLDAGIPVSGGKRGSDGDGKKEKK